MLQHDGVVCVEQDEDITSLKYHIQVKHKETQDYAAHKIRKPIIKFLGQLKANATKHFRLYCHFKDRSPCKQTVTKTDLESILGKEAEAYDDSFLTGAANHITIEFSENYDEQFARTISIISNELGAESDEQALCFHAILRSHLSDLSIKPVDERTISKQQFKSLVSNRQRALFDGAYRKHLGKDRYLKAARGGFFTSTSVSTFPAQRLFIISTPDMEGVANIKYATNTIIDRYYREKNPLHPPTICIIGHDAPLTAAKQELVRDIIKFTDGTCFHGDMFDWNVFKLSNPVFRGTTVRFIDKERLLDAEASGFFDHVFFFGGPGEKTPLASSRGKTVEIECDDLGDVIQLITGRRF